jgi:hypothetical protein
MHNKLRNTLQAAGCLLCAVAAWSSLEDFIGTEIGGGRITGPMLDAGIVGGFCFVIALITAFLSGRVALASASLGFALCLPLHVYRLAPGLFRVVFPGEYKMRLQAPLIWHTWSALGVFTSVCVIFLGALSVRSKPSGVAANPHMGY